MHWEFLHFLCKIQTCVSIVSNRTAASNKTAATITVGFDIFFIKTDTDHITRKHLVCALNIAGFANEV